LGARLVGGIARGATAIGVRGDVGERIELDPVGISRVFQFAKFGGMLREFFGTGVKKDARLRRKLREFHLQRIHA
jgi:hypothetical protein